MSEVILCVKQDNSKSPASEQQYKNIAEEVQCFADGVCLLNQGNTAADNIIIFNRR
jgi:hypothetical protein